MNDEIVMELGDVSEETNGLPNKVIAETVLPETRDQD